MKKVAITGGLSCGKSSVCQFFKVLGAHVVSADEIVHQLLTPAQHLGKQVIALLGEDIVVNGKIDRSIIAKRVFENSVLLHSLEKLIHPIVLGEIDKQFQQTNNQGNVPLFIAEIPLLFETGSEKNFEKTICVWADSQRCIERFMASTGCSANEYEKRMANQMPTEEKAKRADYIIENTGSIEQMQQAVINLFIKITAISNS